MYSLACVFSLLADAAVPITAQFPSLVSNTIYSTNPRVVLAPESSCSGTPIGQGCGRRYDPWDLETYEDWNGRVQTYHRTSSWGNQPRGDQIRAMSFGFTGTSLQIYGAPPRQLQLLHQLPGRLELCMQGICHKINTQELYDSVSEASQDLPVLLWSSEFKNQYHRLELGLLDSSSGRDPVYAMTFHHLVYREIPATLPSAYKPLSREELVEATYFDTNPWVSYSPSIAWKKEVFAPSAGHNETVTHTSSKGNDPAGEDIRAVSLAFRGVTLEVYGAPKVQMDRIYGDSYEHAHQEICIDNMCHAIDAHQLYLNIRGSHAHEPVLLWSSKRFPTTALRHVQLRLLDKESPVGRVRRMTFNRFVVTEVRQKSKWVHPIKGADYSDIKVDSNDLKSVTYLPSQDCVHGNCEDTYAPWENKTYTVPGGQNLSYYHTSTWDHKPKTQQRSLQIEFTGHDIRIYGAPRPYLVHAVHAKQEICLGATCQPVDVERAYLNIEPNAEHHPVLLWSMEDIDVSRRQILTMRMTESGEEAGDVVKGMTFSHAEYTRVEFPASHIGHWFVTGLCVTIVVGLWFWIRTLLTPTSTEYQPILQNGDNPPPPAAFPRDTGYGAVASPPSFWPPPAHASARPPGAPCAPSAAPPPTRAAVWIGNTSQTTDLHPNPQNQQPYRD